MYRARWAPPPPHRVRVGARSESAHSPFPCWGGPTPSCDSPPLWMERSLARSIDCCCWIDLFLLLRCACALFFPYPRASYLGRCGGALPPAACVHGTRGGRGGRGGMGCMHACMPCLACMDASHACAWRVCIHSVRACLAVPYRACIHAWRADMHVCARVACVRRVRDRCGMHPTSRSAIAVSRERNARVVAIRCFAWRLLSLCWPSPSGRVPISAWVGLFLRGHAPPHRARGNLSLSNISPGMVSPVTVAAVNQHQAAPLLPVAHVNHDGELTGTSAG